MPKRTPIRIIVPTLDMSRHEQSIHSSTQVTHQSPAPSRRTYRTHASSHAERRRRHERSHSHPANPSPGMPTPSLAGTGTDIPQSVASPPFRVGPSPGAEPELLPGGGVQIPQGGFRYNQPDYSRYRPRSNRSYEDGDPDNARGFGRMGLGVFRGLRKIPAAIVKAGRSYGPRSHEIRDMSPVPETDHEAESRPRERQQQPGRVLSGSPIQESPIQDDVETYMEPEDEESHTREEQLLYEYIQRKRVSRDRAQRKRTRQQTSRAVPAPRPEPVPSVLVPGAHNHAADAAPSASQIDYSQAGQPEVPPNVTEAEEMRREREELERAQERERARKIYAAEAVRQPQFSSASSGPPDALHTSNMTSQSKSAYDHSPPRLHSHVFSRWSAERDVAGRRRENRPDEDLRNSPLGARIMRFLQQVRDMPWVGDRVAADYIPGGVKPRSTSSRRYTSSPGSSATYASPRVRSGASGSVLPVHAMQASPAPQGKPGGQSWYTPEDLLVLPVGVDPPAGFIPYPFPDPLARSAVSANDEGPASASSHTHVESLPLVPAPTGSLASTSGPGYMNGEAYRYVPAEASKTGQPYILLPMGDGRHQPLVVPGMGRQPAYVFSHPGPPNFVPVTR